VIFNKINPGKKLKIKNLEPFTYDVQKRIPSTEKAKELLGFEATTSLSDMLDIVIPWVKEAKENNLY
jgi:nucleoside-diphosphate-sugar epimerase